MVRRLIVGGVGHRASRGWARLGPVTMPCALGRGGRRMIKREGDGATPIGRWPIRRIYVRPGGRLGLRQAPSVGFTTHLRPEDGWCDAPDDRNYNRPVRHPYPASAERLWRDDHLYDVIVVLGYNARPRRRGMGSAIFFHLMRRSTENSEILPTDGCVGLDARDLLMVLRHLGRGSAVHVLA